jgi:guanyl-specific ribonuclease Sa
MFSNVRPDLVGVFVAVSKDTIDKIDDIPANAKRLAELLNQGGIPFNWARDETAKKEEFFLVIANAPFFAR